MTLHSKGILNPQQSAEKFQLHLHEPSPDLAHFVQHYWIVQWDLQGQAPYISEVLSHPAVHLVFEHGRTGIFGVVSGKFRQVLEGRGSVFGVKFRVGAFYPFIKFPVADLTNKFVPLDDIFGVDGEAMAEMILSQSDEEAMVTIVEDFLQKRLPEKDALIEELNQMADWVATNPDIRKVEDLAARFPYSKRQLQRIFKQYVGISPKWLIQRYRLHEAAELVAQSQDWARLAVDLGYFDQAHFIKDFKALVGQTPMEYAKAQSLR